jgi:membrane associated rhomboid family serine protease
MTLIGINAAVFVLIVLTGWSRSPLIDRLALIPRGVCVAADHPGQIYPHLTSAAACAQAPDGDWTGVAAGDWYQLVTYMFTHVELWHIAFNMIALWFLGPQLEIVLGRLRYVGLYLLSGLVAGVAVLWLSAPSTPTLGASGAIFGLMGALLVLARKLNADMNQLWFWIGLNFLFTFFGRATVSWQGHLGGFVGGVVLAWILAYAPRAHRTAWQAAGFGAVSLAVVVASVVRVAALS